jgi:hypothetical protein
MAAAFPTPARKSPRPYYSRSATSRTQIVPRANHFFDGKVEPLMTAIGGYLDKRLTPKSGRASSAA